MTILDEIVSMLENEDYLRTVTIGERDNPGSISYILLPEDVQDLKKVLAVKKVLELLPMKEWIGHAVEVYSKGKEWKQ